MMGGALELGKKMSPEEAKAYVDSLYKSTLDRWKEKVTGSPFMRELMAGKLSMEAIRLFWKNWAFYVFEINNLIACAYQRHIGFFKRHPDLLAAFSAKVADEYIHPRPPGHILIVLEQGEIFGVSREEMIACEMLAECRGILEFKRGLLYEGTMLEWWSSLATEEAIGHWAGQWKTALMEKYKLPSAKARYFETHAEADLEEHEGIMGHGEFNRTVMQRLLQNGLVDLRPGFSPEYVLRTCVDCYGLFFRGVYETACPTRNA